MPLASEFLECLRASLKAGTFVKLTLSDPVGVPEGLRNLRARPVELKAGRRLSVVECYATREVTQNWGVEEGAMRIAKAFEAFWLRAHVFTTAGDFQFRREQRSGKITVRALRPTFSLAPELAHDASGSPEAEALSRESFLQRLGVTNPLGKPRPGMAGKLRQVQRFSELLGHLLDEWGGQSSGQALRVVDMGAGKGYLTFALAREFQRRGVVADILGVEQRPELVEAGNQLARELGFHRLEFQCGLIGEWTAPVERWEGGGLDVLVALHACNTATDEAIYQGVKAGAHLLLTSPCCHQELRPQLSTAGALRPALQHGILLERQAELVTDTLRALLLELKGYRARVFEFVEPEHSGKNLMLAAIRRGPGGRSEEMIRGEISDLMREFGIRTQRLAVLAGEGIGEVAP
jgi:SAM-dependent methyltransferase